MAAINGINSGGFSPVGAFEAIRAANGMQNVANQKGAAATSAGNSSQKSALQQPSQEEQQEIQRLKQRDTEVRQHEQAHIAVAGAYARGGANFSYTRGPDGRMYATGGEVSIDVSSERTPEATIAKARTVRAAALAPANPSAQDLGVAAAAVQLEAEARQQLAKEQTLGNATGGKKETAGLSPLQAAKTVKQIGFQNTERTSGNLLNITA